MKAGIERSLGLQVSIIMGVHTLLLESGISGRKSLNRTRLLLLDGGIKINASMSRILNATSLRLDILPGDWRLRDLF